MKSKFKFIYGPVASWRLGVSLGIDLLSGKTKICNFNCLYCQLGSAVLYRGRRRIFARKDVLIEELKRLPQLKIDYITLSGRGEPTLAGNLGEIINAIKKIRKEPVAVLTNSSLMAKKGLRKELSLADFVIVKIDAYAESLFRKINQPVKEIVFKHILKGIKKFKAAYKGRLALQIMFIKENKNKVKEIADLVAQINPDEIQINTPQRPSGVKPLSGIEIFQIKRYFLNRFKKIKIISVYDAVKKKKVSPLNFKDAQRRRGPILG